MCKLEHDVYGPPLADPSGEGENLPNIFAPGKAPVPVSKQPTKFGSLLKVALPILEGGAIGATANSRVPGAGSEAAQRFFALQDELALRRQLLRQKTVQDFYQNQLRAAQTQHYLNEPPFARSGGVHYQGISDKDGKLHNYTLNPYTLEAIDRGLAAGPTTHMTPLQTSTGIQSFETAGPEPGKVTPLMTPGTQPESPMEVGEPSVPLQPPERFERPVAAVSRDKAGVESTTFFDPRTVPLGVPVATRAAKPRVGRSSKPDAGNVETYAGEALKAAGGDPDKALTIIDGLRTMPPAMKASVRTRIREMNRPGGRRKPLFSPEDLHKLATSVPQ